MKLVPSQADQRTISTASCCDLACGYRAQGFQLALLSPGITCMQLPERNPGRNKILNRVHASDWARIGVELGRGDGIPHEAVGFAPSFVDCFCYPSTPGIDAFLCVLRVEPPDLVRKGLRRALQTVKPPFYNDGVPRVSAANNAHELGPLQRQAE